MRISKVWIIILALALLCALLGIAFCLVNRNPEKSMKEEFNLTLPSTSKIIKYGYSEKAFCAKIMIDNRSINDIKQQLDVYFIDGLKSGDYPNIKVFMPWWDLDQSSVQYFYMKIGIGTTGFAEYTRTKWAFICEDKTNNCYLLYLVS